MNCARTLDGPSLGFSVDTWRSASEIAALLGLRRREVLIAARRGLILAMRNDRGGYSLHLGDAIAWSRGRQ